jgi:hypothetical protein
LGVSGSERYWKFLPLLDLKDRCCLRPCTSRSALIARWYNWEKLRHSL